MPFFSGAPAATRPSGGIGLVLLALSALAAAAPATIPPPATVADLDRILAVVNDDVITATEIDARLVQTKKQLALEKIKIPADEVLKRQLLERLILERLQLQLAAQAGIRVSDSDIDQQMEAVARNNRMSPEEFRKVLAREGMDLGAYRAQLRTQLTLRQLLEREINNRVSVSESEVRAFLDDRESRRNVNLAYDISHIFISLPESATSEAIQTAKGRAEEILQRLRQGADFEQTALTYSQGQEAMTGGRVGWKQAGQLPELFLAALKTMRPGAVSAVLRSPSGFHVLRLNDVRGESAPAPVMQTHARHILLRPSEIQSLEDARAKLLALKSRIEQGEDFANLARAHSEDTGSAASGGELGWVTPGQLVPEFEKAMEALKPGQLSAPVRTPFGLHLIQVLERRERDLSQERLEATARQQIHARKADERYDQWVRQLRDEAYVEYLAGEE